MLFVVSVRLMIVLEFPCELVQETHLNKHNWKV